MDKRKYKFCALILAAGKGVRMKSDGAKVLHVLEGKPLLQYSVNAARSAGADRIIVIVGHQAQRVRDEFAEAGVLFAEQKPQLGTGHAVLQANDLLAAYRGLTVILCGDVPLLKPSTIIGFVENHIVAGSQITVMTTCPPDPEGYGRVIKDAAGNILKIVEQRDATAAEKKIGEINTGIYCVNTPYLFRVLKKVDNNNVQKEYYLTDIVEIARRDSLIVNSYLVPDHVEVMGINTREQLQQAANYLAAEKKLSRGPAF